MALQTRVGMPMDAFIREDDQALLTLPVKAIFPE